MSRRPWLSRFAFLLVVLVPGAAMAYDPAFTDLEETFWRPLPETTGVAIPPRLTIRVSDTNLDLRSGCMHVSLYYDHSAGGGVVFRTTSENGLTLPCPAPDPAFATFVAALQGLAAIERDSSRLILRDSTGHPIVTLQAIESEGFEYRWLRVTAFRSGGRLVPGAVANHPYPILLFFNGAISGSLTCGGTDGVYTRSGTQLKVKNLMTILTGWCAYRALERDVDAIHDDLDGDLTVEENLLGRFVVRDAQGTVRMVLKPVRPDWLR